MGESHNFSEVGFWWMVYSQELLSSYLYGAPSDIFLETIPTFIGLLF